MPMIARHILRAALLVLAMIGVPQAQAACTRTAATTTTFAPGSSYDIRAGSVATVAAPSSFSCSGTAIVILSSNNATATVNSTNNFTLKNAAGDAIAYRLSADSGGTKAFTQGGSINYFDPALLALLGILNGGSFTPTMYAAITNTPNISAGTYTDTITVNWNWNVCHLLNVAGLLCLIGESGTGTTVMTVTLTVNKDCRISAPNLSFNSAPLASQFANVTQSVAVDCTKDATYSVAFTNGNSGSARPWRAMSDGAGHSLQYNIYQADGVTIWDQTSALPGGLPGTGALIPAQMQVYVAKVNPAQATPPAGRYTDTVSVLITF